MRDTSAFAVVGFVFLDDFRDGAESNVMLAINDDPEAPAFLIAQGGKKMDRATKGLAVPEEARPFVAELITALMTVGKAAVS